MYHSSGQYTGQSLGKRKTKTAKQHHRYHHSNSMHCICTNKEKNINGNSTSANEKYIGMKTATDNNQPINKISYRQQLSTLQNESLQKTKQRKKQNEAIAISPNEIDESTHCFRTQFE